MAFWRILTKNKKSGDQDAFIVEAPGRMEALEEGKAIAEKSGNEVIRAVLVP